jgi:hypothetical protein
MADEGNPILVCMKIEKCPTPPVPSVERDCDACGKPCWVSCASLPVAEVGRVRCMECTTDMAQGKWN